jgi:hypothetical protein
MRFSHSLCLRKCAIVVVLLLVPLIFLTVAGEASSTPFSDDFDGASIDTIKWKVQQNVNGGSGGSITVADSYVILTSDGTSFPLVYTATNPFPTSGDFAVEFDIKYTRLTGWGTGFWISQGPFEPSEDALLANILQVWAHIDETGPNVGAALLGKQAYKSAIQKNPFKQWESSTLTFRLQYSKNIYSLYLNGEVMLSAHSMLRADTIGFGHPPLFYVPHSYPSPWTSFKIDSIRMLQPSSLSISTNPSSILDVGYKVDVSGRLTDLTGTALPSASVLLSYQIPGMSTWNPIASDITDANGAYAITWLAPATGNFLMKTEWAGDSSYAGTLEFKNISVARGTGEALFLAESNSTLSSLAFNSTLKEISFTASGPSETTGYIRFIISKMLVENLTDFRVFLDGQQIQFTANSEGEMQVLYFQYSHSSHSILIKMLTSATADSPEPLHIESMVTVVVAAASVALVGIIGAGLLIYFKKRRRWRL